MNKEREEALDVLKDVVSQLQNREIFSNEASRRVLFEMHIAKVFPEQENRNKILQFSRGAEKEVKINGGSGFQDSDLGTTTIEWKVDLNKGKSKNTGIKELKKYTAAKWNKNGYSDCYIGVLTDGIEWIAYTCQYTNVKDEYEENDVILEKVKNVTIKKDEDVEFLYDFLQEYIIIKNKILINPNVLQNIFGENSDINKESIDKIKDILKIAIKEDDNISKYIAMWNIYKQYSIDTSRRITDEQVVVQSPSDREISSILRKMGKNSIEDELNCGTCGYSTCREKAIAVILGKAEISMCLPYMKEKAESFSDKIISVTPNAIITVDTNLKVQQINKSACDIFEIQNSRDIIGFSVSRILDEFDFIKVISKEENVANENVYLPEYGKFVKQNFIYDKNSGIVICIMKDITKLKLKREELIKEKTLRAEITDKIVEKHMCIVHEIASLLGETAAETQVALTDLKEAILMEEEDYD